MRLVVGVAITLSLAACKTKIHSSKLLHTAGNLSVPIDQLQSCQSQREQNLDRTGNTHYPITLRYIEGVAAHIMAANPKTFQGPYSPSSFCFRIVEDTSFNAIADPENGKISIHTGAFQAFNSDADVAAVLAHELAHVTMQHLNLLTHADYRKVAQSSIKVDNERLMRLNEELSSKLLPHYSKVANELAYLKGSMAQQNQKAAKVLADIAAFETNLAENKQLKSFNFSQWETLRSELEALYRPLMGMLEAEDGVAINAKMQELITIEEKLDKTYIEVAQLNDSYRRFASDQLGQEQFANGKEREADEVGLEFYLRAGLSKQSIVNLRAKVAQIDAGRELDRQFPIYACIRNMISKSRSAPERGLATHPSGCWRVYNTFVELERHKDYFAELLKNAHATSIPSAGSLSEVKRELSQPKPSKRDDQTNSTRSKVSDVRPTNTAEPSAPDLAWLQRLSEMCSRMGGAWQSISPPHTGYCNIPTRTTKKLKMKRCQRNQGRWNDAMCRCEPTVLIPRADPGEDKSGSDVTALPADFFDDECNLVGDLGSDPNQDITTIDVEGKF